MLSSPELAQRVADRLCHDIMGSVQGMTGALDLISEAREDGEREEAVALLGQALAAMAAKVRYAREAFGPRSGSTPTADLAKSATALFAHLRPELVWKVEAPSLAPPAATVMLNLLQIAADCVAAGGHVRATVLDDRAGRQVQVEASGPRAQLRADTAAALTGSALDNSAATRSVQAGFVWAVAQWAGGEVTVTAVEEAVVLRVSFPSSH